jgi:hypothetical protein
MIKKGQKVDKDCILERLDGKYSINEETSCWIWNGTTEGNGKYYPQLSVDYVNYYVYRLMAYVHSNVNDINSLGTVKHTCKNKRCINPDHLKFNKDNITEFSQETELSVQIYMKKTNISSKSKAIDILVSIGIYNFLKEENEI